MRLVIAVIVSACAIAVLIDSPRRELEEELKQQWQEYRQHTIQMIHDTTLARVELLETFSVDAARQLMQQGLAGQVDSVFVDGNHNAAEVMADCQAWWPLLREGGTLCGHDYWSADPGVMDAVQRQFSGQHHVATNTRIWWVRK